MPETNPLEKLQSLLRELFQLDLADLDFGIYRLFRMKRDEVAAFIDEQIPRTVDEAFSAVDAERRAAAEAELAELRERLEREFPDDDVIQPNGALGDVARQATGATATDLVSRYDDARARLADMDASEAQKTEVFVLTSASVPPGDTKGDARHFFPAAEDLSWDEETATLLIPFEHRRASAAELERHGKPRFEETVPAATLDALLDTVPDAAC